MDQLSDLIKIFSSELVFLSFRSPFYLSELIGNVPDNDPNGGYSRATTAWSCTEAAVRRGWLGFFSFISHISFLGNLIP